MTSKEFRQFCGFFIKRHEIQDVDCVSEVEVISEKRSELSKSQRDAVTAIVAYSVQCKMKDYLTLITVANKLDKDFPDIYDTKFKDSDTIETILTSFINKNKKTVIKTSRYCTPCKVECLALRYAFFKLNKKIEQNYPLAKEIEEFMSDEELKNLYNDVKSFVEESVKLASSSEDKKFKKLLNLNLLF